MWQAQDQWRNFLIREIRRKSIHLTGLTVPACLLILGKTFALAFVATALVVALVLEGLRLRGAIHLPEVRESEEGKVAGYVFFILGSLIAVGLFPEGIAVSAMLMLCLGDSASGLAGSILCGSNVRDLPKGLRRWKPMPVVVSMLAVCSLVGYLASGLTLLTPDVYLAGALGATLADALPLYLRGRPLDDNLTIPIFASTFMAFALFA